MGTSSQKPGDSETPPTNKSSVVLLLGDLGDTTWRMFVPTIGLLLAGVYVDDHMGTKPWGLIVGIGIGTVIAGFLIKKQLRKVS